ncbi:hypothetical protein [Dactylosporangium sp. CA-092794]|uniref:hypothetical protein n=1 Tax=Dactylosporangium sp. CA-092794 TaxID=3239929 RepID=UPI003D89BF35
MEPGQAGVQEWSLYWTTRGQRVPSRLVPALGDWLDIDARTPILVDPQYRIDSVLARFFSRSGFAALAEGTREAHAKDYRLFFSILWSRGRYWHDRARADRDAHA